jgi:GDP-L-fucose synthase
VTHPLPRTSRIFVSGHRGLVGSALVRRLQSAGFENLALATRHELDLRDQAAVSNWFAERRPEYVFHVAGTVGGIQANATRPADFLYDNLLIHATVLRAAWQSSVQKLLYLGSSCIYPRDAPQPIREDSMLTGPLELTNEAYAIAKIAGVMSCQAYRRQYGCRFISAMPTNLYGPNDNFDLADAHMLPALIRKFHEAKIAGSPQVVVWGTGKVRRELLHVDDLADACLFLLENYDDERTINIGTGQDATVAQIADLVCSIVYPPAQIVYDTSKPDGTPRKLLDVSRLHALGWQHRIELPDGIKQTYRWYVTHEGVGSLFQATT